MNSSLICRYISLIDIIHGYHWLNPTIYFYMHTYTSLDLFYVTDSTFRGNNGSNNTGWGEFYSLIMNWLIIQQRQILPVHTCILYVSDVSLLLCVIFSGIHLHGSQRNVIDSNTFNYCTRTNLLDSAAILLNNGKLQPQYDI